MQLPYTSRVQSGQSLQDHMHLQDAQLVFLEARIPRVARLREGRKAEPKLAYDDVQGYITLEVSATSLQPVTSATHIAAAFS